MRQMIVCTLLFLFLPSFFFTAYDYPYDYPRSDKTLMPRDRLVRLLVPFYFYFVSAMIFQFFIVRGLPFSDTI